MSTYRPDCLAEFIFNKIGIESAFSEKENMRSFHFMQSCTIGSYRIGHCLPYHCIPWPHRLRNCKIKNKKQIVALHRKLCYKLSSPCMVYPGPACSHPTTGCVWTWQTRWDALPPHPFPSSPVLSPPQCPPLQQTPLLLFSYPKWQTWPILIAEICQPLAEKKLWTEPPTVKWKGEAWLKGSS